MKTFLPSHPCRFLCAACFVAFCIWLQPGLLSAQSVNCVHLMPLFQRGLSDAEIAAGAQLPLAVVQACRNELSRPLPAGPAGAPPMGAAGPPPAGAAGKPPGGAAGPPPMGAPGPPPVGSDIRRLPAR